MTDDTANHTIRLLQEMRAEMTERFNRLDSKCDKLATDMIEVKERLGLLEGSNASISRRVDLIDGRVDRIEKRLDLVPA